MDPGGRIGDARALRQGDVITLPGIPAIAEDGVYKAETPLGVVIVSQTCDVYQASKANVLVAPIVPHDAGMLSAARKGRLPLRLYLESVDGATHMLADLERIASVPKSYLNSSDLVYRFVVEESSQSARKLGDRISRSVSRFPFPNEVYPVFEKLRSKAQKTAGTESAFGKVIDVLEDLRVASDQWPSSGRRLKLYAVAPEAHSLNEDDADPTWRWTADRVKDLKPADTLSSMSLQRCSELLLANLGRDRTTLFKLWAAWGAALQREVLQPNLNSEVVEFEVEVLTDSEFRLSDWKSSESLDLEVLSLTES